MHRSFYNILFLLIIGIILTGCGNDFYSNSSKYDKEYLNEIISAIESGDSDNIRSLFASDLQLNSEDLDIGIQEILTLYQGTMTSSKSVGSATESRANGKKTLYSTYRIYTDKGEYCISYLYQAGGDAEKKGFRHVALCKNENYHDADVMIGYPDCEGAYAYCSDEAKTRINKKLTEAGFDFEEYKKDKDEIQASLKNK
ncbi:MAG: DUF5104 domain-containing protein [Lachnospiraceae bacterium]|nr:DUF5104 domain-containing protein [Lachnospiraceae bacterium]